MSSSDSILDADDSERRWLEQIRKNFGDKFGVDNVNVPVCVFSVPKSISHIRPEAYVPQAIALGPYHHFHPHLYEMERYKVAVVKECLQPDQVVLFERLVVERLRDMEVMVRGCYHKYLDLDGETLAWILAVDGLFLLDFLSDYGKIERLMPTKFTNGAILVRDIMVLENQIPLVILNEIRASLRRNSNGDPELFAMLKGFCEVHSPLKFASIFDCRNSGSSGSYLHLLDFMYHLIVGNHSANGMPWPVSPGKPEAEEMPPKRAKEDHVIENVEKIVEMGLSLGVGAKKIEKPITVIKNVPWEKISNLLGVKIGNKHHEEGEDDHFHVEEIEIPSALFLYKHGGIDFIPTTGGISDVKFEETEARLYLPVITLDSYSEVVLRNLVAYEAATTKSKLKLAQYVDLMSGIIDTEADVRLLKAKGVIKGSMSNNDIVNLFNGMNKSNGTTCRTIERINAYYDNKVTVKAWRLVKKGARDFRQVIAIGLTVFACLLMVLYSFCEVYGCPNFFKRT